MRLPRVAKLAVDKTHDWLVKKNYIKRYGNQALKKQEEGRDNSWRSK